MPRVEWMEWILDKIARHGLSLEEVEYTLEYRVGLHRERKDSYETIDVTPSGRGILTVWRNEEEIDTVDLSEYADDDGIPEVSGLSVMGDEVYALIERRDRNNDWNPVGDSYLVIIDADSGEITGDLELEGETPYGTLEFSEAIGQFVIAQPGEFSTLEGGIELFDPSAHTLSGFVVTEETLGGNVTKALVVSETKGYAIVGVEAENGSDTHLVVFNPETGEKTSTLLETEGWSYSDIVLTPDLTELWIADRTSEKPGVRIFDTKTDVEKTDDPIDVGLPPSTICFTH